MDAIPASPTCPNPRRPALTVVVPVHNGDHDLEQGLRGLRASTRDDFELIVVDDGSTDGSGVTAAAHGAKVVRHPWARGPAAARNTGAAVATAPIVFFLDADVVPHPDTIDRLLNHFERHPELDALFGSYDDRPTAPGLVSQFRNLLHHFVHQQGRFDGDLRRAHTFWTGCGAIRRRVFRASGGFDPERYRLPAIEDIEFGYRLHRSGRRIALARDVLVTHRKRWTLGSMLRTDIVHRGVPWMLLMLRDRVHETDLNVSPAQRACVAATGLGLLGLLLAPVRPELITLFGLNVVLLLLLNWRFYRFLARARGGLFALASLPLHYLYYVSCGVSVALALMLHQARARPRRERGSALIPRPLMWSRGRTRHGHGSAVEVEVDAGCVLASTEAV